ncbi:SDR family NAD(P)-dependent oxidoreductase [Halobacillus sp. K22]|uniref:SDR family NAD(P)-dependent oxidoreductase n=1 Tax=Halobacillus sp. K22 TaxID=3457431 RepID=UPI003FCC6255
MIYINLFSNQGKVAVVTGGGSGIGRVMAETLAESGSDVVLLGRTGKKLEKTAQEIKDLTGGSVNSMVCDVTDNEAIKIITEQIYKEYGHIDILVNNAGTTSKGTVDTLNEDDWNRVMDTNLKSVFFMSQAVVPYMKKQEYGRIINTASVAGDVSLYFSSVYGTSKAGVIHLTKQLAGELAGSNITVNAISPWFFKTDFNRDKLENDEFRSMIENRAPMKRLGQLEELKTSVLYFAARGSSYTTGQNIFVDGGMTTFGL